MNKKKEIGKKILCIINQHFKMLIDHIVCSFKMFLLVKILIFTKKYKLIINRLSTIALTIY